MNVLTLKIEVTEYDDPFLVVIGDKTKIRIQFDKGILKPDKYKEIYYKLIEIKEIIERKEND